MVAVSHDPFVGNRSFQPYHPARPYASRGESWVVGGLSLRCAEHLLRLVKNPYYISTMTPIVSIIMGSTSDLPVMEKAAKFLDELQVPFEMNALSAHRTPGEVEHFAATAAGRGLKVIIAGAGMAAALPGVIAAGTTLPVIGVPIKGMLDGLDALLSIVQMPPGIPVATMGVNGAQNAAILAVEMLALADAALAARLKAYKDSLKNKIVKANNDLSEVHYAFKTN